MKEITMTRIASILSVPAIFVAFLLHIPAAYGQWNAPAAVDDSDPLTAEARRIAEGLFLQSATRCGDAWVIGFDVARAPGLSAAFAARPAMQFDATPNYLQASGLSRAVRAARLSTPDRLNGIAWRGEVRWTAGARRVYDGTGALTTRRGWSPWRGQGEAVFIVRLELRAGTWTTLSTEINAGYMGGLQPFKPECAAVSALDTAVAPIEPMRPAAPACRPWERLNPMTGQCVAWRAHY
jgi:hypothetical protein